MIFDHIDELAKTNKVKIIRMRFPVLNKSFIETGEQRHNFLMKYGFEFCFRDVISGRAGFNAGRFTVGIGLAYKKFRLDYALLTHSELSNTHRVSLGYIF